jgi:hypothetical protein
MQKQVERLQVIAKAIYKDISDNDEDGKIDIVDLREYFRLPI